MAYDEHTPAEIDSGKPRLLAPKRVAYLKRKARKVRKAMNTPHYAEAMRIKAQS